MSATPLSRSTKGRYVKTQDRLKSSSLQYKQQRTPLNSDRSVYLHTYNVSLPSASASILSYVVRGLTNGGAAVNTRSRELHTIALWATGHDNIYRCCFVQPEVSSSTCTLPSWLSADVMHAIETISEAIPGAEPCSFELRKTIQLSGRMTPYVIDEIDAHTRAQWGYGNIAKSRILFLCTSMTGPRVMALSNKCMEILTPYIPNYGVCVRSGSPPSYKITVRPENDGRDATANKNTSMHIFGDGMFKFLGKPSRMEQVATCFRDAILAVATSRAWPTFIQSLEHA